MIVLLQYDPRAYADIGILGTVESVEQAQAILQKLKAERQGHFRSERAAVFADENMTLAEARALEESLPTRYYISLDFSGFYEQMYRRWLEHGDLGTRS